VALEGQGKREKEVRCELIIINERFRRDLGDLTELKDSIVRCGGLVEPVVLDEHWNLVAGARRLQAYKELGYELIPARIVESPDSKLWEAEENICRRGFTPAEIVAAEDYFRSEEYARCLQARQEAWDKAKATGEPIVEPDNSVVMDARRRTAELTGMSARTVHKVRQIVEAAKENPDLQSIVDELNRTHNVHAAWEAIFGRKADPVASALTAEAAAQPADASEATVQTNDEAEDLPLPKERAPAEDWRHDGRLVDAQREYLKLKWTDRKRFRSWMKLQADMSGITKSRQWDVGPACEEFLLAWNAIEGIKHVNIINDARRAKLRKRWLEEYFRANWRAALAKIPTIPGLLGYNDRGWVADIEWFLRPHTVPRLLEGSYDHWKGTPAQLKKKQKEAVDEEWMKAEASAAWKREA
jgi:hypothetical protein